MQYLLLIMATRRSINPLHKPVHPHYAKAVIIVGAILAVLAIFTVVWFNTSPSTQKVAYMPKNTPTPTENPTPVDTSSWKTYTDWKYGYTVKLPPEFAGTRPDKGFTGDNPDPDGTGRMDFEDTTLSGNYPNRTAKYGFNIQFAFASQQAQQCTTDQECLSLLTSFYKNIPGKMAIHPIQATILNRTIKGLAVLSSIDSPPSSLYYFYNVAVNGKRFSCAVNLSGDTFQHAQTKDPVINAILSTISFNQ
jgi:hypothetical protein